MPDYAFRSKPVPEWSAEDMNDFRNHIANEPLPRPGAFEPVRGGPRNRVRNVFDSVSYQGPPGSPFAWHRDIKARLSQADTVNQDLALMKECMDCGMFKDLPRQEKSAMFTGMANKMATVRYGYEAGSNPERAADYKSQMSISMEYGGIKLIEHDIDQWRSSMQELLNSEYEKSSKPNSRYVCRFFNRKDASCDFDRAGGCVFYDANLLDAYLQEFVADAQSAGQPVKDLYRFTTAADDYDLRYRVTKSIAVAQGERVMSKEDWIANSKAQAAYADMVGWGPSGTHFQESESGAEVAGKQNPHDAWLLETKARVDRANKLYADLEVLCELPQDKQGHLKYQPSAAICKKCGWSPKEPANPGDKKISGKEMAKARESAFRKELLLRTVDVLYGPRVAHAVEADSRFVTKLPAAPGEKDNPIQKAWDELKAGNFEALKDRVIEWSGTRLEAIEQEDTCRAEEKPPIRSGMYHNCGIQLYSKEGILACMHDILQDSELNLGYGDRVLLPKSDMDMMYSVYSVGAEVRGESVLPYDKWREAIEPHPEWDLALGEFVAEAPVAAKPEPVLPKSMRPQPHPPAAGPSDGAAEAAEGANVGEAYDFGEPPPETGYDLPPDYELYAPPPVQSVPVAPEADGDFESFADNMGQTSGNIGGSGHDMSDVDAAMEEIMGSGGGKAASDEDSYGNP